jgi:hypothetical protein
MKMMKMNEDRRVVGISAREGKKEIVNIVQRLMRERRRKRGIDERVK